MRTIVLVVFTSLVIAAGAVDAVAQTAGSMISVSTIELRELATGWSAKKQILGKGVYNDAGEKVGEINDLIVTPDKACPTRSSASADSLASASMRSRCRWASSSSRRARSFWLARRRTR